MSYSIDTTSLEYRPTSNVPGSVENGELTMQTCTVFHSLPPLNRGELCASDYLAKVEANPRRAAALARARERAGRTPGRPQTLTQLRMAAGLSQAQLASKMGTQQPNIARWEREPGKMNVETILRFASALGVAAEEVFKASSSSNVALG